MKKLLLFIFCCFLLNSCKKDEIKVLSIVEQNTVPPAIIEEAKIPENTVNDIQTTIKNENNADSVLEENSENEEIEIEEKPEVVLEEQFIYSLNISFTLPTYSKYEAKDSKVYFSTSCSVFADEFFDHGNTSLFGYEFLEQFENDNRHIVKENILSQVEKANKNILYTGITPEDPELKYLKKYYKGKLIGEERYSLNPSFLEYKLSIVVDGYLCVITCKTYYYDVEDIVSKYPHLYNKTDKGYYILASNDAKNEFYKILFEEKDDKLPEIMLHFRNTINSINETLYIPQYDKTYHKKLLNAGFSKKGEYTFIGGHSPEYMFIWAKEKINEQDDFKLYLFDNKEIVGYYKDITSRPMFFNSTLWFNYDPEEDFDRVKLEGVGIPEVLKIGDKEHVLNRL